MLDKLASQDVILLAPWKMQQLHEIVPTLEGGDRCNMANPILQEGYQVGSQVAVKA